MMSTSKKEIIHRALDDIRAKYPLLMPIVHAICIQGGTVLLVGGAVRDIFLGLPMHDLDCEVYGLSLEKLQEILQTFGTVMLVGVSFGVLKLRDLAVDWSVPRSDSAGRKPEVTTRPHMAYADAFRRRDLTINAMGIDLHTNELVDPYNGYADVQQRILRAPDITTFVEDPLRLYRVMQFVGRFAASVAPELQEVCKTMDVQSVSRERVESEFEKLLLKSVRPSLGLRWLRATGRLQEIMPELFGTIDVPQRPDFHPEGDVFEHSMQALDAAAAIARTYEDGATEKKLILLYAALCHDLGKQDVTVWKDDRWRSTGHAEAGVPRAKALLGRITGKKKVIADVCVLVEHHMAPGVYAKEGAKLPAYKKLAHSVAPHISLRFLADLSYADRRGRNAQSHEPLIGDDAHVQTFIATAQKAGVLDAPEPPLLRGEDLLAVHITGAQIGRLLTRAYELQLRHGVQDKEELKKWVLTNIRE